LTAAGTSYTVNGLPMLPVYIYYSMFGFQRVGDLIWAAADQRTRGFLVGATSGRTTLGGEGLQHQDGTSHVTAATIPNCRAYDPAYAYEVAVIMEHGMRRMLDEQHDEFYYLTVTNENAPQPGMPADARVAEGILRGMYRLRDAAQGAPGLAQGPRGAKPGAGDAGRGPRDAAQVPRVRLLGSGAILREALAAADLLQQQYGIAAEVWSVTSFSELARDAQAADRARLLGHADAAPAWLAQQWGDTPLPTVAATDYVRAVPEQIRQWVAGTYRTLGTDGFGRSDTRAALRDFFEVGADWIALTALDALGHEAGVAAQREKLDAAHRAGPSWTR
jgi:pyruvate dehydrogenase E1 component